jgi:glycosyltransferase involved in cell wall biosynthesis
MQKIDTQKLRVLLIAEACNPTFTSVPLVGYNLCRALALRQDLSVTVVTHVRNKAALESDVLSNLARVVFVDNEVVARPLYLLGKLLRGGQGLSWTTGTAMAWPSYMYFEKKLFSILKKEFQDSRFDIVHRITPLTPTMGSPLARLIRTPMVLGPLNGGLPWPKLFPELRRQEREWLVPLRNLYKHLPYYRSTYKRVAAVISGSRHTSTEVPGYFLGARFQMPENGIDTDKFPTTQGWSPPKSRFRFITVGRMVPYKGTDMILDALNTSELLEQSELMVVGDGPYRRALEQKVLDLNLRNNVRFVGWKTQTELSRELHNSQAFVFPSLREFGGGVVLEAMASGLPCVVVDYGGPSELVDSTCGILLPLTQRNELVADLRRAMLALVRDPQRCKTLGENGQRRVLSEFTWHAKAEKISSIYQSVLKT